MSPPSLRHFLSWKPLFYEGTLPALRTLGPARADATLGRLGRLWARSWPSRYRALEAAAERGRRTLNADWDVRAVADGLASALPRSLARDYLLDGLSDERALGRFDIDGLEHLDAALAEGRGVVLLGSHLGAHLAGVHALYRRGVPLRLLVQKPSHISKYVRSRFERDSADRHPQDRLFLKRGLSTGDAVDRVLRARAALRDNLAVYLNGDIPWDGPNTRAGVLLGQGQALLAIWADLAALARAPVVRVFCTHAANGRFSLRFDPPVRVRPGEESTAVTAYLARLEDQIRLHPSDAVAHLTWPCYGPPASEPDRNERAHARRSRRHAPASPTLRSSESTSIDRACEPATQ